MGEHRMEKGEMHTAAFADGARMRAQAAVEMLSYAAFFLLVFVASVSVFFQQESQGLTRAESAYAQQIADSFADSIQTAFVAGPGFSQQVSIPHDLLGKPYKILVSYSPPPSSAETGFVYVEWNGVSGSTSFSAKTITSAYSVKASTVNPPFISFNESQNQAGGLTDQITIDASRSQQLCVNNAIEDGVGKILIQPPPC